MNHESIDIGLHCRDVVELYIKAEAMERLIEEGLIREWGLSQVDVAVIDWAQRVTPLTAIQNIYSMVEQDVEQAVIPYCMEHNIGVVPFSPIASGLLSGKITTETKFERNDDVRNWVPQLSRANIAGNQPVIDLLNPYAGLKHATPAQISLAWMLHKYPNVVPISGSKNKERILKKTRRLAGGADRAGVPFAGGCAESVKSLRTSGLYPVTPAQKWLDLEGALRHIMALFRQWKHCE